MRLRLVLLALFLLAGPVRAGGDALVGQWKVTIFEDGQNLNFWLLRLESKDGKLTGSVEPMTSRIPATKVSDISVDGDLLHLKLQLANNVVFRFEGKLPRAGAKKVLGSVNRGGSSTPAFLEATQAKDAFEAGQELLTRSSTDPRVFGTALELIEMAKERKKSPQEVQEWVDTVLRSAELYGPTYSSDYGMRLMTALQDDFPSIAVEVGSRLEKNLDPKASADSKLRLLTALSTAFHKAGFQAKAVEAEKRIDAVEGQAYKEYAETSPPYKVAKYEGKAGRPVLVELFTGAQCPPCVAADLGFDGLEKAYGESSVVLLQYHVHIPGPDALTNADNEARADYYARSFRGTPAIYFNGRPAAPGGGGREDAEDKYKEYREVVETLMKKQSGTKVTATAARKGDVITIQANAALDESAPKAKLRIALVEEWARYKGRNGLSFHHRIVRAMPGGAAGFAVADKSLDKSVTVDLNDLRKSLTKYLDDFAKNESAFPDAQRPMRLRDLHAVAFVQNDETNEVLAAISVPVKGE